jgi:DNA-directed RNA polymerase subunit K/omega
VENSEKHEWFFDADLAQLLREDRMTYLMINVITKRAKQLTMGERPLAIPANGSMKRADIATAEVYEGKLEIHPRKKAKGISSDSLSA